KCGEPVASCAPLADHGQIGQQRTALPYGKRQGEVVPDSGLEIPQDTNPQPSHRAPRLTYRIAAGTIARPQNVFHGHFRAAVTLSSHRLCKLTVPGFVIRVSLVAQRSQESHGTDELESTTRSQRERSRADRRRPLSRRVRSTPRRQRRDARDPPDG